MYIHRSGRTGRAGRDGISIVFYKSGEEQLLRAVERRSVSNGNNVSICFCNPRRDLYPHSVQTCNHEYKLMFFLFYGKILLRKI